MNRRIKIKYYNKYNRILINKYKKINYGINSNGWKCLFIIIDYKMFISLFIDQFFIANYNVLSLFGLSFIFYDIIVIIIGGFTYIIYMLYTLEVNMELYGFSDISKYKNNKIFVYDIYGN